MKRSFVSDRFRLVETALDMLFYDGGNREKFLDFFKDHKLGVYREDEMYFDEKLEEYREGDLYSFDGIEEGDLYELGFCILGVFTEKKPLEIIDEIVEKHIECLEEVSL